MEENKKETLEKKWQGVVVKALTDESFKTNLVTNPIGVMKEHGLTVPEECTVAVETGGRIVIQTPENASDELKEEVKWWMWRLDMTREFGHDEQKGKDTLFIMTPQEEAE
jgi:hypothetical protein|tara:strand:- start:90 stop:419 length:330 start_codon:yes stop_codon:yes gene_type:complete